jgi:nucleotidyltransferase/DNA polymerase involved in DNA repair
MTEQVLALVDCNNFYASCERVFNPKLDRQPVVAYPTMTDASSPEAMKPRR